MKMSIIKLRALYRGCSFHTVKSASQAGYYIDFKLFSLQIVLLSRTIIVEV